MANCCLGIIILNFATDTGAWLIGKNFGKHKLWPSVSPGKTIEGFLGGIALATIFSALYWWNFMPKMETNFLVCLFILTIFSQVGDLVQSRLKRSFNIKDSSNIIPGHGGIHDRIDSLLFVMPFYLVIIKHYFL